MQMTRVFSIALAAVASLSLQAQPTNQQKQVTLNNCIQMALKGNLDVQIQRRAPEIARLTLSMDYAPYDPNFSASFRHNYGSSPSTYVVSSYFQGAVPGSTSQRDEYSLGLGGNLPSGLNYQMSGNVSDTVGTSFQGDPPVAFPFANTSASVGISMSQPILRNFWIDSSRMTILVDRHNLRGSKLTLKLQVMTSIESVTEAYYNLIAAQQQVNVQQMALQLAQQLYAENKKRVEIGVLAPLDEMQSKSQVASSQASLVGARNAVATAEDALKNLVTDHYATFKNVDFVPVEQLSAQPRTFSREDSWDKALTLRPDLLKAKLDLQSQHIRLRYDKNQLFPELDVVGSYSQIGNSTTLATGIGGALDSMSSGQAPNYYIGAQLSIPLSNRRARRAYQIQKEQIQQALLQLKQLEQNIMVQVDTYISQARNSLDQVQATAEAVTYAKQALDAEQKKLENGKSTSFQVLQLQSNYTAAQYSHISALVSYNIALARLALWQGTTLERHNISMQFN